MEDKKTVSVGLTEASTICAHNCRCLWEGSLQQGTNLLCQSLQKSLQEGIVTDCVWALMGWYAVLGEHLAENPVSTHSLALLTLATMKSCDHDLLFTMPQVAFNLSPPVPNLQP